MILKRALIEIIVHSVHTLLREVKTCLGKASDVNIETRANSRKGFWVDVGVKFSSDLVSSGRLFRASGMAVDLPSLPLLLTLDSGTDQRSQPEGLQVHTCVLGTKRSEF